MWLSSARSARNRRRAPSSFQTFHVKKMVGASNSNATARRISSFRDAIGGAIEVKSVIKATSNSASAVKGRSQDYYVTPARGRVSPRHHSRRATRLERLEAPQYE